MGAAASAVLRRRPKPSPTSPPSAPLREPALSSFPRRRESISITDDGRSRLIRNVRCLWIPAYAGMTDGGRRVRSAPAQGKAQSHLPASARTHLPSFPRRRESISITADGLSRLIRNGQGIWIPAYAGMTEWGGHSQCAPAYAGAQSHLPTSPPPRAHPRHSRAGGNP